MKWIAMAAGAAVVGVVAAIMLVSVVGPEKMSKAATSGTTTARADGITLAVWGVEFTPTIKSKNTLVYRGDSMVLETEYSDGSSGSEEVIERPTDKATERRFDLEPDSDRSEYVTLSESGDVKYFSWEGRQFKTASATVVHADFMVVGANAVTRGCVPKRLSETSKETVRLYEQLHAFKNDPEFARKGFGVTGSYHPWLQAAKDLHAEGGLETLPHLGFLAGDVMQLGMEYMSVATRGGEPTQYIRDMERTIQAGLTLATCRTVEGS